MKWVNGVAGLEKPVVRAGMAAWRNKWWFNAKNVILQIGWGCVVKRRIFGL
jgi:hypothetical protein